MSTCSRRTFSGDQAGGVRLTFEERTSPPEMKGISVIHDETKKKRYVQIDLELIGTKRDAIDDLLDLLLIESRKDEPTVPFEEVEKQIKRITKPRVRAER